MTDKILVGRGEKQVYGTQYKIVKGKVEFLPIENPDRVNQKRGEMTLESIEDYMRKAQLSR